MKPLVILESHTKIRNVGRVLGRDYELLATAGHLRRMPEHEMGVDFQQSYEPIFQLDETKAAILDELRSAVGRPRRIILATDPDREGEGIAWHLCELLDLDPDSVERCDLAEMTPDSIRSAFSRMRRLNTRRVGAYLARRVLDRLIGYTLSPWLNGRLEIEHPDVGSVGRVQSPALRLICDREAEIEAFDAVNYWMIGATFDSVKSKCRFAATLQGVKPSDSVTVPPRQGLPDFYLPSAESARTIAADASQRSYAIRDVETESVIQLPPLPFETSSLLVAASSDLGFTAEHTMNVAQQLFEGIDETNITRDHCLLYELIWNRFMGSQMAPAVSEVTRIVVESGPSTELNSGIMSYVFTTERSRVDFPGHLIVGGGEAEPPDRVQHPSPGEPATLVDLQVDGRSTVPPEWYTEGGLIEALKQRGIGRPSTYASCIATLLDHRHVYRMATDDQGQWRLRPTPFGCEIISVLAADVPRIIDDDYTRGMEEGLDAVEDGLVSWQQCVDCEYQQWIVRYTGPPCPDCGRTMMLRRSQYGLFWGCAEYPDCTGIVDFSEDPGKGSGESKRQAMTSQPAVGCDHCRSDPDRSWVFCHYCGRRLQPR